MMDGAATTPARAEAEAIRLKSREFRYAREASWLELEELLASQSGLRRRTLTAEELIRLPTLYRAALSSLSIARSIGLDQSLEGYLENLCFRAFLFVYAPDARQELEIARQLHTVPAIMRHLWRYIGIAATALLAGCICGYAMVAAEPGIARMFLEVMPISLDRSVGVNLFQYSLPMALLAAGLGLFLGVPTVAMLLWHGLLLGAGVAYQRIFPVPLPGGAFLLQVGVLLVGQCLCGAAGLRLGASLAFPGRYSRASSAALATDGVAWLVGLAMLLMLAGSLLAWVLF